MAVRLTALLRSSLTTVVGVCLVLGVAAAAVGGPLDALGAGPGGLAGVPALALVAIAALLGVPAGVAALIAAIRRRGSYARALLLLTGPALIVVAFWSLAHALDPCAAGVLDLRSRFGSVPTCQPWGGGVEVHARFHLLLHAGAAAPVAGLFLRATRPTPPASDAQKKTGKRRSPARRSIPAWIADSTRS